jgi:hypothetical protein
LAGWLTARDKGGGDVLYPILWQMDKCCYGAFMIGCLACIGTKIN